MLVDKRIFQCCVRNTNFFITYSVAGEKETYAVCNSCYDLDCFFNCLVKTEPYDEDLWTRHTTVESELDGFCRKYASLYLEDEDCNMYLQILHVSKKKSLKIAEKGMEIANEFVMSLVNDGFIERYKFQKRKIKYQQKKIIQRFAEIRAMGDDKDFRELYYEDRRLEMADKKIQCDKMMLDMIFRHASQIPKVKAQFDSLNTSKL